MTRVFVALGSNLGDRAVALAEARAALTAAGIELVRESTVLETDPVGITDQPPFLNQVLEVETELDPHRLLTEVKAIERRLGRRPGPRWGPRRIDIDILLYGDQTVDTPELRIPHPELRGRPFLQHLLAELDPRAAEAS